MIKDIDSENVTHDYIQELVRDRAEALETATRGIDTKSGTFLGLLGVFLVIAVQSSPPSATTPGDLFFTFLSYGMLVAAMIILSCSMSPKSKRFDPDPEKLKQQCWDRPKQDVVTALVDNLVETWKSNLLAHERKAQLQRIALWLATVGFISFAFTLSILRPFWLHV